MLYSPLFKLNRSRGAMTANILDGRAVAAKVKAAISAKVAQRQASGLRVPGLDVILVGEDPASATYVSHKKRACDAVGIRSHVHQLPNDVSANEIADLIDQLNASQDTHGILLQLPLPEPLQAVGLLERIHPQKDVDGFHPYNLGRLAQRRPLLRPCTPLGVMTLLKETGENIAGANAVIVGASNIVGRPMALELLLAKCSVTVTHRFTKDLALHIRHADIIVVAIGKRGIVKSEWIKPGAIVIDVGFNRLDDGKICGDIDFDTARQVAGWITPVPGGVGQMTVATLLENTLLCAELLDGAIEEAADYRFMGEQY